MGYDTKPNLDNTKFEQRSGDTLNLSGQTVVIGGLNIQSGATFNIALNDKSNDDYLVYYNSNNNTISRGASNFVNIPIFSAYTGTTIEMYNDINDPTGFIDNINITVSYNNVNRTITLSNPNGIYYYNKGIKYALGTTWTSTGHTNNNSAWYLYHDGTNFSWSNTVWKFTEVQVAARPANSNWAIREVHGYMPHDVHEELHQNFGTYRKTGFGFTNGTYALQPAIPSNTGNTIGFESGIIKDEDLETDLSAWLEGSYTRLYFSSASTYNFETSQSSIFRVGSIYPKYNPYNGNTFTETEMSSGEYANWYVVRIPVTADVNSQQYRAVILQPQFKYTTLSSAQAENPQNLYLGGLISWLAEYVLVERITMYTNSGYTTATGRVRIEAVSILSGNRFSQTNTTVGLGSITAGNVSVVPVSPFTSINMQSLSDEYANKLNTTISTANNGLTKFGSNVSFGGILTGDTSISYGTNRLCFLNTSISCIDMLSDCSKIHVENTSICLQSCCTACGCLGTICLNNCGSIKLTTNSATLPICITAPQAMKYAGDYSGIYTARSIPDVAYVTGKTSTSGIQTASNGLTKSGTQVRLGGTLTGTTTVNGAQTLRFNVSTLSLTGGTAFNLSTGNGVITDTGSKGGLQYAAAYDANVVALSIPNAAWVTGTTKLGNYYTKTQINGYTGTTVPNTYYNKTQINGYTGQTNNRITLIEGKYVTGATNGLTKTGSHDVCLGGALSSNVIVGTGSCLFGVNSSIVNITGSTVSIGGAVKLTTTPTSGLCTDSVLVWNSSDKTVKTVSGAALGDKNNIYSYTAVTSNVTLSTGSSFVILANPSAPISISLPATPINGQVFRIKDVSGNALTNNITINGNGKNIDGDTCALINTNYGSFELLYNGTNWFNLSFVF